MGLIFDIKKFAIHDGPGIRTTVFFKGCPLTCVWCHNPEGIVREPEFMWSEPKCLGCKMCQESCSRDALSFSDQDRLHLDTTRCNLCRACISVCHSQALELIGREMTVDDVLEEIEKDILFYDESKGGVTFSGGEPLMQPEFLYTLLKSCRTLGIHTAVDTSGYAPSDVLAKISEYTDLFLYDVKVINDEIHTKVTGASNKIIFENLEMLQNMKKNLIVRIPVIPGINDDEKNISELGEFISSIGIEGVNILPYHKGGVEKAKKLGKSPFVVNSPSSRDLSRIEKTLISFKLQVKRGG